MKKFEGLKYFTNKAVLKTIKTICFIICQQIFDNGKLFFFQTLAKYGELILAFFKNSR